MAYDPARKMIHVFFLGQRKDGGKWYRYQGCDRELWDRFLAAPSKGRFVLDVLNDHPFDTLDSSGNRLGPADGRGGDGTDSLPMP